MWLCAIHIATCYMQLKLNSNSENIMRYLLIIFLVSYRTVFSQIWKDPNDTLSSFEKLPRLEKKHLDVKSYTISQFDSSGNEVMFDFFEFNKEGILVKSCVGVSSSQELDTTYYDQKKAVDFPDNKKVFELKKEFNKDGNLSKISTYKDGQLTSCIQYYYPDLKTIAYSECHRFKVYDVFKTACDSTIGFFNKKGDIEKVKTYFFNDSTPHIVNYKYDRKARLSILTYEEITGNASTEYIRNRRGLMIRIENKDEQGRVYNYSKFEYTYR